MSATIPARVQFIISGKFLALLLLAVVLLVIGLYSYNRQQQTQNRFQTPPYFVNRGPTIVRGCEDCLDRGQLKPRTAWKVGTPTEVPATGQRWFLAVEDPPAPVIVTGVLMLPVYPAFRDNPAFGFDQNRVMLVLYQNLQRKPWIEQPQPPAPPAQQPPPPPLPDPVPVLPITPPAEETPAQDPPPESQYLGSWQNEDSSTNSITRFSIASRPDKLIVHAWGKCQPQDCDWNEAEATPTGQDLAVLWDQKFALRRWDLSLEGDDRLRLSMHSHYNDGREDRAETSLFVRSPDLQQ